MLLEEVDKFYINQKQKIQNKSPNTRETRTLLGILLFVFNETLRDSQHI